MLLQQVRKQYRPGLGVLLARRYGVHPSTVALIVTGIPAFLIEDPGTDSDERSSNSWRASSARFRARVESVSPVTSG